MLMCTFFLDDTIYGVDASRIVELLRFQPLRSVALADPDVAGLINLRGQVVVAIDLRRVLGLAPRDPARKSMNILTKAADSTISLLVDRIGDVAEVPAASILDVPDNLDSDLRPFVTGTYVHGEHLVLVVDTDAACGVTRSAA